jgi:hypothetical protein
MDYVIVSIAAGLAFGVMDGLINANPMAAKLSEVFKPIARERINLAAGIIIDLAYGFALCSLFLLLFPALPGGSGLLKGLAFALMLWFLRVVMQNLSYLMMFRVGWKSLWYFLATGLLEMLVLGAIMGLFLPAGQ